MYICTFIKDKKINSGIKKDNTIIPIETINQNTEIELPCSLSDIIQKNKLHVLKNFCSDIDLNDLPAVPMTELTLCAPYDNPAKIIGVGLNFSDHARDLQAKQPEQQPASFIKPATTIIGPGDTITLPAQSSFVTGEAEIGVIISKECKNISIKNVPEVILGYTTIIDMTAVDILKMNPRFLTRAKSFDSFFSFGPWIVTQDEIKNIEKIKIETTINGKQHCSNLIKNMRFSPFRLVSFFSQDMTLKPGDIISCGTPGAVTLHSDDIVGCYIKGIGELKNKVSR
ncbi:MAG: fumarylacetoacetate hydrolase family protein [bacterium]